MIEQQCGPDDKVRPEPIAAGPGYTGKMLDTNAEHLWGHNVVRLLYCTNKPQGISTLQAHPQKRGKTSPPAWAVVEPRSGRAAACRISTARAHSGTRCSRLAFILVAGIVHTNALKSISSHLAPRASPGLAGGQHHELEAQLRTDPRRRGVHRFNGAGNFPMPKRRHVPCRIRALRQRCGDGVAGRVSRRPRGCPFQVVVRSSAALLIQLSRLRRVLRCRHPRARPLARRDCEFVWSL